MTRLHFHYACKAVRGFHFIFQMIHHYSITAKPFGEITGKHTRFKGTEARQKASDSLTTALLEAPVPQPADIRKDCRVEPDANDSAVGGVLLQPADGQAWHPVAHTGRKLSSAEYNYTAAKWGTDDCVHSLKIWRVYSFRPLELRTDTMGMLYPRPKPNLTKRDTRWVEFLGDYDFTVCHMSERENSTDPLSSRPDLEINGINYILESHEDIYRQIASVHDQDLELLPIVKRLRAMAGVPCTIATAGMSKTRASTLQQMKLLDSVLPLDLFGCRCWRTTTTT